MEKNPVKIILIVWGAIIILSGLFLLLKPSPKTVTQIPADSEEPASGICESKRDKIATIIISSDSVPSPRCVKVWGDSRLNFSNALSRAVSFSLGAELVVIPASSSKELDFTAINYFAPGVHWLKTIEGVGSIPELWIIPPVARSETATAPEFDEYPAGGALKGTPATVNFDSYPAAKTFKTKILEGAKLGPNFAGHYTVVDWGCGTQCQVSAIIDAENGNIIAYGIPSGFGTSYRLESRLFIVNPNPGPEATRDAGPITTSDFYVMNGGKLMPLGRFDFSKGFYEPVGCPEIETTGRNVITGETKIFTAPCLLPYGWEIVSGTTGGNQGILPYDSGVEGQVLLGPICPAVQSPPDPECADKPYQTTVQVIAVGSPKSSPFATAETDKEGRYKIILPPGDYNLQAIGGNPFPSCEWQTVTIEPGNVKEADLMCDTGIR